MNAFICLQIGSAVASKFVNNWMLTKKIENAIDTKGLESKLKSIYGEILDGCYHEYEYLKMPKDDFLNTFDSLEFAEYIEKNIGYDVLEAIPENTLLQIDDNKFTEIVQLIITSFKEKMSTISELKVWIDIRELEGRNEKRVIISKESPIGQRVGDIWYKILE